MGPQKSTQITKQLIYNLYYSLQCTQIQYSILNCSVLENIVHGWGTDYQSALNETILGPLI